MITSSPVPILTATQSQQIDDLATSLSREQAVWVSGYFAGVARIGVGVAGATDGGSAGQAIPAPAATAAPGRTLTVLYGTDTGNSRELAGMLTDAAKAQGLNATAADLADYKPRGLKDEQDLLIIASTHGEGEPPPSAIGFFEFLEGKKAPKLAGVRFAVLALGDSTYEIYCGAGRQLDERLEALGAERLAERVDCDVDYEDAADAWIAERVEQLAAELDAAPAPAPGAAVANGNGAAAAPSAHSKRNPFHAEIIENQVLTGRGSSKETRHVELSIEDSGLTYAPGDALGIVAQNDPELVGTLLDRLGLAADAPVTVKKEQTTLEQALRHTLEITAATPRFIEHWAQLAGADELAALIGPDQAKARTAYLDEHHVLDIVERFSCEGLTAEQFVAGLRPLQPRLYSIASSLAAAPDEVHLTVSTVEYELHGSHRTGVASGHLARLAGDDAASVPVYVQANEHFHLPADDVPIIMIGAGTGVAPYRAFLQERRERGAAGQSWLFFGERNFRTDFLYQVEWQEMLKDGTLTHLDLAWSRDLRTPKTYVQDRLRRAGKEVYGWLQEGAAIYVCGDAANMAPDVHQTLLDIAGEHGGLGADEAQDYFSGLKADHRYRLDVY